MCRIDLSRSGLLAACAMLLLAMPARAGADALVLDPGGVSGLSTHQVLPSSGILKVPAGAAVKLLRDDSVQVVVRGPYEGPVRRGAGAQQGLLASLLQAFDLRSLMRAVVLRAPASRVPAPGLIDLTSGGTRCTVPGEPPLLWHPAPASGAVVAIRRRGGPQRIISWPRDRDRLPWPASLELVDRGTYVAQVASNTPIRFTMRTASGSFATPSERLKWLADMRCVGQAEAMLATLEVEEMGAEK